MWRRQQAIDLSHTTPIIHAHTGSDLGNESNCYEEPSEWTRKTDVMNHRLGMIVQSWQRLQLFIYLALLCGLTL